MDYATFAENNNDTDLIDIEGAVILFVSAISLSIYFDMTIHF